MIGGIFTILGLVLVALDDRPLSQLVARGPLSTVTATRPSDTVKQSSLTPTMSPIPPTVTVAPTSTPTPLPPNTSVPAPTATPQRVPAIFRGTCYANTQTVDVYASASGVAPNSRDDAGNTVTYDPSHLLDCNADTAWRVEYALQPNPILSFRFNRPVALTRIGFVPGYDKRDPLTNQWRWYQNRRISSVAVVMNYQDGQSCVVESNNIPDNPDALWIDVSTCRQAQIDQALLVTNVDVRVGSSRPPAAKPIRNFVVVSDMFFEGFTYEK